METASPVLDRRESNKVEKRRRIVAAARAVFNECGYAGASIREIARRAGVGTGTIFLYAPDKRSLLLWVLNADLAGVTETSFAELASARAQDGLLEQLGFVFEARYRYWGMNPDLSLHALIMAHGEETTASVRMAGYFYQHQNPLEARLEGLVREQQRRGTVRASEDPQTVARLIRGIYNASLRIWLHQSDVVGIEGGMAELRKLLRLAMDGFAEPSARGAAGTLN